MSEQPPRASARLQVRNRLGLHLRAASLLVQCLAPFAAEITVAREEKAVNGKSILALVTLDAPQGTEVEITAVGDDAEAALAAVTALFESRFNEDG
jgi:phosphocarrier protein NPr